MLYTGTGLQKKLVEINNDGSAQKRPAPVSAPKRNARSSRLVAHTHVELLHCYPSKALSVAKMASEHACPAVPSAPCAATASAPSEEK